MITINITVTDVVGDGVVYSQISGSTLTVEFSRCCRDLWDRPEVVYLRLARSWYAAFPAKLRPNRVRLHSTMPTDCRRRFSSVRTSSAHTTTIHFRLRCAGLRVSPHFDIKIAWRNSLSNVVQAPTSIPQYIPLSQTRLMHGLLCGQSMVWHIVGFNVRLDTLLVISGTILQVRWSDQQCHSTEGQRLLNQVKGQSHQAQLSKS